MVKSTTIITEQIQFLQNVSVNKFSTTNILNSGFEQNLVLLFLTPDIYSRISGVVYANLRQRKFEKLQNLKLIASYQSSQEMLLDCDQSNVLLVRIIFFGILLKAFLFLSACIRDPASK